MDFVGKEFNTSPAEYTRHITLYMSSKYNRTPRRQCNILVPCRPKSYQHVDLVGRESNTSLARYVVDFVALKEGPADLLKNRNLDKALSHFHSAEKYPMASLVRSMTAIFGCLPW